MGKSVDIQTIIGAIYDAAIDPAAWQGVLRQMNQAFNGVGTSAFLLDRHTSEFRFWLDHELPNDEVPIYHDHYVHIDPRVRYGMAHGRPGHVMYDYRHSTEQEMNASEYYNWLEANSMRYYLAAVTQYNSKRMGTVTVQLSANQGHVDRDEIELFELLAPHFHRATCINDTIGHLSGWQDGG